jgi:hypothetical protein
MALTDALAAIGGLLPVDPNVLGPGLIAAHGLGGAFAMLGGLVLVALASYPALGWLSMRLVFVPAPRDQGGESAALRNRHLRADQHEHHRTAAPAAVRRRCLAAFSYYIRPVGVLVGVLSGVEHPVAVEWDLALVAATDGAELVVDHGRQFAIASGAVRVTTEADRPPVATACAARRQSRQ